MAPPSDQETPPPPAGGRGRRRGRGQATPTVDPERASRARTTHEGPDESAASGGGRGAGSAAAAGAPSNTTTTTTGGGHQEPIDEPDQDTLRIMVSTDNHLGYAEDDNVRGNDSFAALEEVLYLAKHYRCDMVLLAGDLFHENRPSRRTLYKTMEIFRRYCMGHEPIQVEILPSTTAGNAGTAKKSPFARGFCNYEDEFYSVDLPVFAIHGNHDDPSRDGGNSELYAALDLLDVANLVNYFGRQEDSAAIGIDPILLKKGTTHVGLYGLGSMRDERLNRMWRGEQVSFSRPDDDGGRGRGGGDDDDEPRPNFFNIFCLHQNRDYGRGTKNCIKEDMIPEWMDLVIWGHEHECEIELNESVVGTFRITQPGSSVATSLVVGEAARKKVGILDVKDSLFRLRPIPLTQVRSFVIGAVNLAQEPRLDPDDPKVDIKVAKTLEDKVRVLILDAKEKRDELLSAAKEGCNILARHLTGDDDSAFPLKHTLNKQEEVLVRLKVDHTGFSAVNNQRFGAKFVGQVANPTDILLFHRKKAEGSGAKPKPSKVKNVKPLEPEEMEEMNIEDLIVEQLEATDCKLQLFDEKQISTALESYVDKQQAQAINETISTLLGKQQKKLIQNRGGPTAEGHQEDGDENEREKENSGRTRKKRTKEKEDDTDGDGEEDDDIVMESSPPRQTKGRAAPKRALASRKIRAGTEYDDDDRDDDVDDEDDVVEMSKPPSKTAKSKTSARGSKKAPPRYTEDSEENDDVVEVDPPPSRSGRRTSPKRGVSRAKIDYSIDDASDDGDDDDEIEVVDDEVPPKRKRGKASEAASSAAAQTKRGRGGTGSTAAKRDLSQSQLSFQPSSKRKPAAPTKATSSRRNRPKDDDSDGDDFAPTGRSSYEDDDDDWGTSKSSKFK